MRNIDDPDAEDLDSANYSTSSESDEDDQEAQTEEDDSEREEGMELDAATLPGAQTAETQIENDFKCVLIHIRLLNSAQRPPGIASSSRVYVNPTTAAVVCSASHGISI